MIHPCPVRIDCDNDNPFVNLSSEGLEIGIPPWVPPALSEYWRLFGYCCDSTVVQATSLISFADAQDLLAAALVNECPDCGPPRKFCAQANCPDGTNLTEICVTTSQADADALALAAETAMRPFCDDTTALFNASCACPDGSNSQTVFSNVSEAVAQAQCDAIPRVCPNVCNTPQSCTVFCPDGTEFTYTVPACVVYAQTQAEADALAHALACERAQERRVCLGPAQLCACANQAYSTVIRATGAPNPPLSWAIVGGTLPTGLSLDVSTDTLSVRISGTPTTAGIYNFTLRATMAGPSTAEHSYNIRVIAVSTTSLPDFTIGTAYSFQMQATGGSGNYAWRIASGSLPAGLTMSLGGLITGIPTASGSATLTFEVIDQNCESTNNGFFPPRIQMVTTSQTYIRTIRGWPVWTGSDTTLYKRATFSGFMTQIAFPYGNNSGDDAIQCAGAKYVFSGSSAIDIYGNHTERHSKDLAVMCTEEPYPTIYTLVVQNDTEVPVFNQLLGFLIGYCWLDDPNSCEDCPTDENIWPSLGDRSIFGASDVPNNMLVAGANYTLTPTVRGYNGTDFSGSVNLIITPGTPGFPHNHGIANEFVNSWPFIRIESNGTWDVTLSEPYTAAEAQLSQQRYNSNSRVAENTPNYNSFTLATVLNRSSRTTDVQFSLNCSNLVDGSNYTARYDLVDSSGTRTQVTTAFTANGTTHTIIGSVPTPAAGHTIEIRNPTILFAP